MFIGGRALFFGRPRDVFGMGGFYYNLSDELEDALDPLQLLLRGSMTETTL